MNIKENNILNLPIKIKIVANNAGTIAANTSQGLWLLRVIGFINQPLVGKVVWNGTNIIQFSQFRLLFYLPRI